MSSWRLRTARNQDAERVERFLLSIREFAGSVVPEEERRVWRWLFVRGRESPDTAVVAENGTGEIVAHYGIARLAYRVDGKDVPAGMICKLAIAEPYRREPLFLRLTLELLKTYPDRGLGFLQGLANRAGLVGYHRAFGFRRVGDVPVSSSPFASRASPDGRSSGDYLCP
jgi:predicted N-acetyltransferase YhbS